MNAHTRRVLELAVLLAAFALILLAPGLDPATRKDLAGGLALVALLYWFWS